MNADSGYHLFRHHAMATVFEILVGEEDRAFAEGAARAAFDEIDRIEQELSRYVPNSDVSRLNNLEPHGSIRLGLDTYHCLRLSFVYRDETGGAFDVAVGALMECWVAKDKSLRRPSAEEVARAAERTGMHSLELDEETMTARAGASVPLIDLGAIGKGYAVDRAMDLLKEWGVGSALVHGGMSSVYAFGMLGSRQGWPVTLSHPERTSEVVERILLHEAGLGGSGIRKGRHIIDPRRACPVEGFRAAWVVSESAARSDALSTACMVMSEAEIRTMIGRDARLRAVVVEAAAGTTATGGAVGGAGGVPGGRGPLRFGIWPTAVEPNA